MNCSVLCSLVAAVGLSCAPALGSPILSVQGLPAQYLPGDTFAFQVILTDAIDLAAYNIDLLLAGPGNADVDYQFVSADPAPLARYMFGSTLDDIANFLSAVNVETAQLRLTLSDFHDPDGDLDLDPVTTVAGANDHAATISVWTDAAYMGELSLSFDIATLQLDNADVESIEGFDDVAAALDGWSAAIPPVPEPATAALLLLGFGLTALSARRGTSI